MSSIRTPLTVSPHEYIGDSTGRPLDYGIIFFGEPSKDPEFYPINVYSDEALTQLIPQPIRTKGGFINVNGDIIELYGRPAIYSIKVLDQYGRKIFYKGRAMRDLNNDDIINQISVAVEQAKEDGLDYARQELKLIRQQTGYIIVGSFKDGASLSEYNDVIKDSDGAIYRWGGDLPKIIPSNSTPETTGGFSKSTWLEVSSTALHDDVEQLKNGLTQYHYTQMGKAFNSSEGVGDTFASWPHENIDYDDTTDKFVIFYNTNSGHSISQCSVLMRTKSPESEKFSPPLIIASDKTNFSYKTQGSGIAKNGDYLSLVARFPWSNNSSDATFVYRSTDKGVTFTRAEMTHNGASITAYNGDVSGFLVTESGRILTFANHPSTRVCRIYYSDDNGVTWNQASIAGNPTDVSEPAWCDLGGGKLVCLARASIVSGTHSQTIPAKFMTSMDNGLTWTAPVNSKSITNLTLSNGTLLPDYERKTVEFIHHSRRTDSDNFSSILRSWATFDEAFKDEFKPQVRVGKLASYIPLGSSSGDSGYVGAAKSKSGVINAFYYTGDRKTAQISWMVGLPNTSYNSNKKFDYNTGEPAISSAENQVSRVSDIYLNGVVNRNFDTFPFGDSFSQGETKGDWLKLKTPVATSTITKKGRMYFNKPINLDNVKTVGINIRDMTTPIPDFSLGWDSLDVQVAIYAESSVLSDRLAFITTSKKGILTLDVSSITGDRYIAISLGSRHPTEAFALVDNVFIIADTYTPFIAYDDNTIWHEGAQLLGIDGFEHVPIDADEAGSIDTTGNILKVSASSITKSASKQFFINKKPLPVGIKAISYKVQNKNYATLEAPNQVFAGLIDTLSPTTSISGVLLSESSRDTSGWLHKMITIPSGTITANAYFFLRLEGGKGDGIESYIKDINIHY